MKISISALVLLIMFAGCNKSDSPVPVAMSPAVNEDSIRSWLSYLSSDDMNGRASGHKELEKAHDWLAVKYNESGLKPLPFLSNLHYYYTGLSHEYGLPVPIALKHTIGYIEGTDPVLKKEFIVVSSHLDHINQHFSVAVPPESDDIIYNGANDDASGVVGTIALARLLRQTPMKRSVVFVAFSSEESDDPRGSQRFTDSYPFFTNKVFLNINLEMIGVPHKNGLNKYMITGPSFSNLADYLIHYNQDKIWKIDTSFIFNFFEYEITPDILMILADNYSFCIHNVLAHTFGLSSDLNYHSPKDETTFIDYQNMYSYIEYLKGLIINLSSSDFQFRYNASKLKEAQILNQNNKLFINNY